MCFSVSRLGQSNQYISQLKLWLVTRFAYACFVSNFNVSTFQMSTSAKRKHDDESSALWKKKQVARQRWQILAQVITERQAAESERSARPACWQRFYLFALFKHYLLASNGYAACTISGPSSSFRFFTLVWGLYFFSTYHSGPPCVGFGCEISDIHAQWLSAGQ